MKSISKFNTFVFCILISCFLPNNSNSQNYRTYSELGFLVGGSYYLGDLNPGQQFKSTKLALGLVYKYNTSRRFAIRANAFWGNLYADDAESNDEFQIRRNLMFRSRVLEFSTMLEFNFFPYEVGNSSMPATPYIFGGLGIFRTNPQALLDNVWYDLKPLGTEGQGTNEFSDREPYSLVNMSIPFGIGFKFHAFGRLSVAMEWGMRKTFTDYIDDVSTTYVSPVLLSATNGPESALLADRSLVEPGLTNVGRQRGNSQNKDWYSFAGLTLTWKLQSKAPECAAYR
jgi:hypothetical protein